MQKKGDMSGKRRFALAVVMVAMVATSAARIAPAAVGALQPDGVMTYHHLSREHTFDLFCAYPMAIRTLLSGKTAASITSRSKTSTRCTRWSTARCG